MSRARTEPLSDADRELRDAKLKQLAERETEDFIWLMRDVRGRRFLWRTLSECHVFKTSFTGNSQTFFNEGERNVGLRLLNRINTLCPERYLDMIREAQTDREDDDHE